MFNENCLHDFIRILGKTLGDDALPPSNYTVDDALALRSRLISPLEPNPCDNHNTELENLVTLVRSLLNQKNQNGEYLAGCYLRAIKILSVVNPPNAENEPESYFTVVNGDLLYELSKLLESPFNIVSARLYGVHPTDYMKATRAGEGMWAA